MNANTILGILTAIAFLLPALIILSSRLLINISLVALVVYFLVVTVLCLMAENIIVVDTVFRKKAGVFSNYLDVPLMLTAMLMFCTEKWKQRVIIGVLVCFTFYELIIFSQFKLGGLSSTYVMGPGIILVLLFSFYLFMNNIKATIVQGKGIGKTLMISSILFAYGSYFLVYVFAFIQKTSNKADVFIIYYVTSIIFALVMSAGLIWVKKRLREIKEVQTTRKELNIFFNNGYS
jgi:hypothetical protein